jgi:hypothetical protein
MTAANDLPDPAERGLDELDLQRLVNAAASGKRPHFFGDHDVDQPAWP